MSYNMKSDVEDLMPRLLPIECGDTSSPLNLDGPPRNPQEYLRQVQLEAALCPEVVVAQIDPRKLKKPQTFNVSVAECHAAPAGFSPSLEWQQRQVSNFSDVRQSITSNRQHWSSQPLDDNVLMPEHGDEEGWKRFCLGVLVQDTGIFPSHTDQEAGLDYSKVGFPPFLSIVSRFSQSTVLAVLDILIGWFEERNFVPQLGRWLYALLACLEKPLLPEAHSSIRQLARRCAQLRTNLESQDDDNLPPLNLLICLVARYFEQNDLADQPE
ncbi:gem-associated protein 2 [Syngnathoides biaculeatus]|uniref:gem-associated protein 2 n=1 Tax=Syngnathoides biaculeatus TaxID=300417 RepID=UPI002ADD7229|nr:gem-associated protein 2 [Syngnathoides biaculeatus]XP_061700820.1 gem-associated protein 2 [Syngnathoides biaculeatus]